MKLRWLALSLFPFYSDAFDVANSSTGALSACAVFAEVIGQFKVVTPLAEFVVCLFRDLLAGVLHTKARNPLVAAHLSDSRSSKFVRVEMR